jgi:hypothetical protein
MMVRSTLEKTEKCAMQKKAKEFTFNVFVESTEGAFIAHCMETGLVATSNDMDELAFKMEKMLFRQVLFALQHNNPADIYHPAPPDVWERFLECKAEPDRVEKNLKLGDNGASVFLNQNTYAAAAAGAC